MAIKKIRISNFKSFKDQEIELRDLNILIGANASGKSNFIEIFKFLRDVVDDGLDDAISMQGGIEYLRNIQIGSSRNLSIEMTLVQKFSFNIEIYGKPHLASPYEITYKLSIKFINEGLDFRITEERIIVRCEFYKQDEKIKEKVGQGEIIINNNEGVAEFIVKLDNEVVKKDKPLFPKSLLKDIPTKVSFISHSLFFILPYSQFFVNIMEFFRKVSIYDFKPMNAKQSVPITTKPELEEDGRNLAKVIRNILKNKDEKRKFFNFVNYLLPFVFSLDIGSSHDKSVFIKLKESYFKEKELPTFLISDGTINIIALILALYFGKRPFFEIRGVKPLLIIEEPDRNIHPYLISKVVEMMKDASKKKQIIVTTHNPEILRYAGLENILLIYRDNEGFSKICRPCEKEELKHFLKNEIGIEELYVQNLLDL